MRRTITLALTAALLALMALPAGGEAHVAAPGDTVDWYVCAHDAEECRLDNRSDPVNLLFANVDGDDPSSVLLDLDAVLPDFRDQPFCDPFPFPTIECGQPSLFVKHDKAFVADFQRTTDFVEDCFGLGLLTDRKHLRLGIGESPDAAFGVYFLGAVHRDLGCPHEGVDFNAQRDEIAAAFAGAGYVVEYRWVGNTLPVHGDASDGYVAVIWINAPPSPGLGTQGSVNCDGAVGAVDALGVLQAVARVLPLACFHLEYGNVNCDGALDSLDALAILLATAHLPYAAAVGCPAVGAAVVA